MRRRQFDFSTTAVDAATPPPTPTLLLPHRIDADEETVCRTEGERRTYSTLFWLLGILALTLLVVGIVSLRTPSVPIAKLPAARFSQLSNVLFVLPVVSALIIGSYSVATVFAVTFLASCLHHGCVWDDDLRAALATETFIVAGIGLVVIVAVAAVGLCRRRDCDALWLLVLGSAALVLTGVALGYLSAGRLDGCAYIHDTTPDALFQYNNFIVGILSTFWAVVDDTAAIAALVVALADFFREPASAALSLGAFYTLVMLTFVLEFYHAHHLVGGIGDGLIFAIIGAGILVFALSRLCVLCTPSLRPGRARRRYNCVEVLGAALVGVAALLVFVLGSGTEHGWWHALASLALLLIIDAAPPPPPPSVVSTSEAAYE